MPLRLKFDAKPIVSSREIKKNVRNSRRYLEVHWRVACYPPCIVAGGGPSLANNLDNLKRFEGDIFAINDTAGYLSDNGISSYLFSIDPTDVLFKIGPLVKGAIFASRVHREQFKQFHRADVRKFNLNEDSPKGGTEGGPTSVCRAPHLLLRIGYTGVLFIGCEGSFYDKSHATGLSEAASMNLMVVDAGGIQYLTNAAFIIQCEYLAKIITKHPHLFMNLSGGLLDAMLKYPDTWEVVAVGEDLKAQYEAAGAKNVWTKDYDIREHKMWVPRYGN